MRDPTNESKVSAVNLAEVIDVMARIYDQTPADMMQALALLEAAGLTIAPVDAEIGVSAGELHARHYDRKTSPLSMADCVALATAMALDEPLATSDPPLAIAARTENVQVIALPDAEGRLPTRTP